MTNRLFFDDEKEGEREKEEGRDKHQGKTGMGCREIFFFYKNEIPVRLFYFVYRAF